MKGFEGRKRKEEMVYVMSKTKKKSKYVASSMTEQKWQQLETNKNIIWNTLILISQ